MGSGRLKRRGDQREKGANAWKKPSVGGRTYLLARTVTYTGVKEAEALRIDLATPLMAKLAILAIMRVEVRATDDSERIARARASVEKNGRAEFPHAPFESMMRGTKVAPTEVALTWYVANFVRS